MARRVFFSFHYARDIFRVNVVRNSDVTKKNVEQSGYWDHSLWEETKKKGEAELRKLIADGLTNTSVTIALTGAQTSERRWVRHELVRSFERGNGLITLHINSIKDTSGKTDTKGNDPLGRLYYTIGQDGKTATVQQYSNGQWQNYMTISAANLPPAAKSAGKGFLSVGAKAYDWVANDGYNDFAKWIETAAKDAGK